MSRSCNHSITGKPLDSGILWYVSNAQGILTPLHDEVQKNVEQSYLYYISNTVSNGKLYKYTLDCTRKSCTFELDFATFLQKDYEGTQWRLVRQQNMSTLQPYVIYKKQDFVFPSNISDPYAWWLLDHHGNTKRFWKANEDDVEKAFQLFKSASSSSSPTFKYSAVFNGRISNYLVDFQTMSQQNLSTMYKHDIQRTDAMAIDDDDDDTEEE